MIDGQVRQVAEQPSPAMKRKSVGISPHSAKVARLSDTGVSRQTEMYKENARLRKQLEVIFCRKNTILMMRRTKRLLNEHE